MHLTSLSTLILGCAMSAGASTVTLYQTGTVGFRNSTVNVVDTYGYFGPAGESLAGDAFSVAVSYDSSYFSSFLSNPGFAIEETTDPDATTLLLTINGVAYRPDTSAGSDLVFQTSALNEPPYFEVVASDFTLGFLSSSDPVFGMALLGLDSLDYAVPGFRTDSAETLDLNVATVVSTATGGDVPEPATLPLALTGAAAIFALYRRAGAARGLVCRKTVAGATPLH